MKKVIRVVLVSIVGTIALLFGSCSKITTPTEVKVEVIEETDDSCRENYDSSRGIFDQGGNTGIVGNPPPTGSSTLSPGGGN